MRGIDVTLIEHGDDILEASEHAYALAKERNALMVPSYHIDLVCGVATYWWELLRAVPDLDVGTSISRERSEETIVKRFRDEADTTRRRERESERVSKRVRE